MLGLTLLTMREFAAVRSAAVWLMVPYFAWTVYVTYLTGGFWWLNPA